MAMSGFLTVASCWRHRLQCTVITQSFLRLLKQYKLAVGKLDLSRGGSYSVSRCVRPWIKFTPVYPFNLIFYLITENMKLKNKSSDRILSLYKNVTIDKIIPILLHDIPTFLFILLYVIVI